MKLTALVLTLLAAHLTLAGDDGMPKLLHVKAWRGKGKARAKTYPTTTVAHLPGFEATPVKLGKFGGWMEGKRHKATGFFYPKKVGDRWWLIDPEGHRFLHVAVVAVRAGSSPANKRAFPAKFGTMETWRDATVKLLGDHGFNGTGNWSDDAVLATAPQRLVYTTRLSFMGSYGKKRGGVYQKPGHLGYPHSCIFVFDPEFESFADDYARRLAATKDDPWLLGHFSDNEMPYPSDLLDRYLKLPATDPGHRAAKAWLAGHGGKTTRKAREEFLELVADRYLRIVSAAIRKHDPNHLYLGSRYHGGDVRKPALWRAAGRHCGVIALNLYSVWTPTRPMLATWERWSGKPVLITEWYAKGDDSGMKNITGAGWTVATQRDRGLFYQNFTLGLLRSRACVGWHWFKYMDNDPEDTRTDPSNRDSNKGIVTTSYERYAPLLDAMKELNAAAYPLADYFDDPKIEQGEFR